MTASVEAFTGDHSRPQGAVVVPLARYAGPRNAVVNLVKPVMGPLARFAGSPNAVVNLVKTKSRPGMQRAVNDKATTNGLVREFWGFAHYLAAKHSRLEPFDHDRAAVQSDAVFGLWLAARNYDKGRKVPLVSYMRMVINRTIVNGYRSRFGRCRVARPLPLSLDRLADNDGFDPGGDEPGFAAFDDAALVAETVSAFRLLTPIERSVMRAMYVDGKSQTQVAAARGVTQGAVCIVHRRAIKKLRQQLGRLDDVAV